MLGGSAVPENGHASLSADDVDSIHSGGGVDPAVGLEAAAAVHDMQPKAADIPFTAGTGDKLASSQRFPPICAVLRQNEYVYV